MYDSTRETWNDSRNPAHEQNSVFTCLGRSSVLELIHALSPDVHVRVAVRLYGWCPQEQALVLEFCELGSLDHILHSLPWYRRVRVATHVARALLYLHMRRPEVCTHPRREEGRVEE
jgi:hypothetical protein